MRVLMVTSSYPLHPGDGTAPFIEEIARGVVRRGHQVDVLLPEHPRLARPAEPGLAFFPYRYAPTPRLAVWGYAQSLVADTRLRLELPLVAPLAALGLRRELAARLRAARYDVAHLHWVIPNAALVTGKLWRAGVPQVVSLHGSDVFMAERRGFLGDLAARAFHRAGAVTACSGDLRRRAVALGAPADRTRTVPYGVDAALFAPRTPDPALRRELGAEDGELLVFAFGRLVEKKGLRFLVDAAARSDRRCAFAIAGDGDLRASLEQQAQAAGARVRFTGALSRERVAAALAVANVVAVPSVVDSAGNVDGLPNALLEALAAGAAVVASRVAGIPDVVADGINGLLVPPGDGAALAAAIARLAADPALRSRLAAAARERARAQLTWDAAAQAFEECYVRAQALDQRPRD